MKKIKFIQLDKEKDWSTDTEHYNNWCKHCQREFLGHRYRRVCLKCSSNLKSLNEIPATPEDKN